MPPTSAQRLLVRPGESAGTRRVLPLLNNNTATEVEGLRGGGATSLVNGSNDLLSSQPVSLPFIGGNLPDDRDNNMIVDIQGAANRDYN